MRIRVVVCAACVALLAGGCAGAHRDPAAQAAQASLGRVPMAELRPAGDPRALLDSARALMLADENAALVTVDAMGQPRVRSVHAFLDPADSARAASGVTVWVMTRRTTRKVAQIRQHPQVTLYFNDDAQDKFATVMGTAVVHTDPENPGAKRHYDATWTRFFWPDFPRDFIMLEIRPQWLEYLGPGVPADSQSWRPQAVVFDAQGNVR